MYPQFGDLPAGVVVVIAVIAVIQVILDVVALIDLYRRPVDRVALSNKWIWLAIILLVNLLGAILYLAVGRKPAPAVETESPSPSIPARAETIADALNSGRDPGAGPR